MIAKVVNLSLPRYDLQVLQALGVRLSDFSDYLGVITGNKLV